MASPAVRHDCVVVHVPTLNRKAGRGMGEGEILFLAIAIAASPFPVIPAILLLFTARPRPTSLAFLGGWFASVLVVTGLFAALSEFVDSSGESPAWLSWVRIVVGVALVVYGAKKWRSRHTDKNTPAWLETIQQSTPRSALRLAVLLTVANPKVVLLAVAGGLEIGATSLTPTQSLAIVVGFALIASMSVAVPVLAFAVAGDSVLPPLARAKDWLITHNSAVMAVVFVVIGLVLLKNGIAGL